MEISAEPLVMKIFDPLIIHSPFSSIALVFVPLESEPASGSVKPNPHKASPVQS